MNKYRDPIVISDRELKLFNSIRLAMVAVSINVTGHIYATYKKSDFCFNIKRNSKLQVELLFSLTSH